jgi:hypothetical protein
MSRWLARVLKRIREHAAAGRIMFTLKARQELAELALEFDDEDARDIIAGLTAEDSGGRMESFATGEWIYLFKPEVSATVLYVKMILRSNCVVISFHEDDSQEDT